MLDYKDTVQTRRTRLGPLIWVIIMVGVLGGIIYFFLFFQSDSRSNGDSNITVALDGNAMEPTLLKGSKAQFVARPQYQRGDIVWLNDPVVTVKERHVRRIVAVGGESLQITNGILFINGAAVDEPYIKDRQGIKDFGPVLVPTGQVFVLGDNRAKSQDSRQWGSIRADLVRGVMVG